MEKSGIGYWHCIYRDLFLEKNGEIENPKHHKIYKNPDAEDSLLPLFTLSESRPVSFEEFRTFILNYGMHHYFREGEFGLERTPETEYETEIFIERLVDRGLIKRVIGMYKATDALKEAIRVYCERDDLIRAIEEDEISGEDCLGWREIE